MVPLGFLGAQEFTLLAFGFEFRLPTWRCIRFFHRRSTFNFRHLLQPPYPAKGDNPTFINVHVQL